MRYHFRDIERKWIRRWEEEQTHRADLINAERPYYNLMMFPYPSAEGLHVGNVFAFTGSDIQGRYRKACGFDVFQPMGFDAFGIHSENFAIKTGGHPGRLIADSIRHFRDRQLKRIAAMFDWSHEIISTDPGYYRWTQWIFIKLFQAGLAYQKEAPVNWCPSCKTVLADEQAAGGSCERCGSATQWKSMRQWFFRITAYAQRLLDNLDWIDWSESTKSMQRRWIGRSEGAAIVFGAAGAPAGGENVKVSVFTTRPDTLWGATFLVLAPDHPEVRRWVQPDRREAFRRFQEQCSDWVSPDAGGHAGRENATIPGFFTGSLAIHPGNKERIPVWVSPYVLSAYGEGAVMGVPAHDQRDFVFARAHGLPVVEVIRAHDESDGPRELAEAFSDDGVLINSGSFSGMNSAEARSKIVEWLEAAGKGKSSTEYRLHDWCISRQRYWGPPIPMIHCPACGAVPVPEDQLPVPLPWIEDFQPDGSGVSPLGRSPEFLHTECPDCGGPAERDTDVSDNFLDSAWYFLRYPSTDCETSLLDAGLTARWLPVDMYVGGNEHAVLHLLYTRFITMALHDMGLIPFEEPFKRFRAHGLITRHGAKMSKSKGNVVNPDDYLDAYGADALRTTLMFAGNFQDGGDFRDKGITGIVRFFDRIWRYVMTTSFSSAAIPVGELLSTLHGTVKKVTEDIQRLHYNTAIAALMELFNTMLNQRRHYRITIKAFLQLLAPFAPCLCHELWERLGEGGMILSAPWPAFDESKIRVETVEYVFQVDGKIRARARLTAGAPRKEVENTARAEPAVMRHLAAKAIDRIVFVPDKLVNIVTGSPGGREAT